MTGWLLLIDGITLLLVIPALLVAAFVIRRLALQRRGGTFEASLRLKPGSGSDGWTMGIARYESDSILWYRMFSPSMRPKRVLPRSRLQVTGRHRAEGSTPPSLLMLGTSVIECELDGEPLALAMPQAAVMGFLSWLESGPPGPTSGVT